MEEAKIIGKQLTKSFEYETREEFFRRNVEVANLFVHENDRLTRSELIFLAKWCEYIYLGLDKDDHKRLFEYMLKERVIQTINHVSLNKARLSGKRWLRKEGGKYVLPKFLIYKRGEPLKNKIILTHGIVAENRGKREGENK